MGVVNSYEHLTLERMQSWTVEAHNAVVQAATAAQAEGDVHTVSTVLQEIVESSIHNYMDQSVLGALVRDIVDSPSVDYIDPEALFLDSVSTLTENFSNMKGTFNSNYDKEFGFLRNMLIHTEISLEKMRALLESAPLRGLGLVGDHFNRVSVRKATDALYRQANYNLLREDSEGFAKLMTEYFTTVNNEPPTSIVVSQTYQRVNAFIGTFDLDVGRVLDITLDVLANLLVKHGKFFVKFLRVSAWWPKLQGTEGVEWEEPEVQTLPSWAFPEHNDWRYTEEEKEYQLKCRESRDKKFWSRVADLERQRGGLGLKVFFELGARRITQNQRAVEKTSASSSAALPKTEAQAWTDEWIEATGTLPPPGNDIAAQLLGFKFQFYASETRDAGDVLPDNLIYLAALLIKIGFISIMDLYPHLYPPDEAMPELKLKLEKEQKEREMSLRGKSNALAMAGALPDDTVPPAVARLREAESKPSSKTESERSTPAKSDDDTSNSLPEPINQKVALVRSLLCIGAIPEALFIIGRFSWLLDLYPDLHTLIFRLAHHSLSKVYDSSRPVPLEKIPSTSKGTDSNTLSRPGDYVPRRTLRWAKPDQKDAGDGVDYKFYWEEWVDNVPVCQTVDDVFLLCSTLLGLIGPECGRDTVLMTKLARIGKKSVIEDPSAQNTKRWIDLSATLLAPALTFTGQNPGVVNETWELLKRFDTATRYSIYANWFRSTKPAMRDAFKKVTDETKRLLGRVAATNTRPMGRAMAKLAYACPGTVFEHTLKQGQSYINMIDALVECSRYLTHLGYDCLTWTLVDSLIKDDRETLQGDGMLVKGWLKHTAIFIGKVYKRYSLMDPTPVLQLVKHQVFRPEGELFMLFVLEQLLTTMGGIGLTGALTEARVVALSAGPILRANTLNYYLADKRHEGKPAAKRLLRYLKESGLAPQILVALARQVDSYLFRKELEDVPDKVVFTNFDKLRSNFAQFIDFLRENIPTEEFDEQFPDVAELMVDYGLEPNLAFQICRASIAPKLSMHIAKDDSSTDETTANGDIVMGDADETDPVDAPTSDAANGTPSETLEKPQSNPHIDAIAERLKTSLPESYQDHPFLNFFITFWSLDLSNIHSFDDNALKTQYDDEKVQTMKRKSRDYNHRHAREECSNLDAEYDTLLKTTQLTKSRLSQEMHQWFEGVPMLGQPAEILHDKLLQDCFFPRLRMSLQDAQYSASMLFYMHKTGVPIFRLSKFLDKLFNANKLSNMIVMMSEEEVKCFGRFLNHILRELQRWHEDKNVYEKSAFGEKRQLFGFGRTFDADKSPSTFIDYDQFRILHSKWHTALFNALKTCLKDGQYTELYNSINVLKAVSPAFPKVDHMATELRQTVENYAQNDDRNDVKVAANSLLFEFKRSAKFLKSETFFRTGLEPVVNKTAAPSRTTSEQPKTPQAPDTAAKKLNASVAPFRPRTPEVNGQSKAISEKSSSDDQKPPAAVTTTSTASRPNGRDTNKVAPSPSEANATRLGPARPVTRPPLMNPPPVSTNTGPMRPDTRSANQTPIGNNRATHALPTRPDAQPPRGRQNERPNDRTAEYPAIHGRHEVRPNPTGDYGRLDRSIDAVREPSPGHRRSRSPHRGPAVPDRREWPSRDVREFEERPLRPPPREVRGPPNRVSSYGDLRDPRDPRDGRDQREYREREPLRDRPDPRGMPHVPHTMTPDGRNRLHSSSVTTNDGLPPRRDAPSNTHHADRGGGIHSQRSSVNTTPVTDRTLINPERAALITDDRGRHDPSRHDREPRREERDSRRDRGSRPQSPRRDERPLAPYNNSEVRRDYRDERPQSHIASRDRREDASSNPPTGPRGGGRDVPAPSPVSRDIFQPSQPSRPRAHPTQDPNYGRLNQPADSGPPSGPRRKYDHYFDYAYPNHTNFRSDPVSDRRDNQQHAPAPASQPTPAGIHPSRMNMLNSGRGPSIQTDVPPNPPIGPRGSGRAQPAPLPSPTTRNPPTGPASNERNVRHGDGRNPLRTINSVLTGGTQNPQPAPSTSAERSAERSSRRSDQPRRERSRSQERRGEERPRGEKRDGSRREGREGREPREGRERSERDHNRERRGDDRDRRSRGGDEMRERGEKKRGREGPEPQHGESKRSRR